MKRDLDLARQLLADIEGRGADCAISALRPGVIGGVDECVRYHIRLLIDAGLVVEVERAAGSSPCVRLTDSGHDFLELAHSEARWNEAKWLVQQRTGGLSLSVLRTVLAKWALDAVSQGNGLRPRAHSYRPGRFHYAEPRYYEPRYRYENEKPLSRAEPKRVEPPRSAYLERFDWREPFDWRDTTNRRRYEPESYYQDRLPTDWETVDAYGASLPTHVV